MNGISFVGRCIVWMVRIFYYLEILYTVGKIMPSRLGAVISGFKELSVAKYRSAEKKAMAILQYCHDCRHFAMYTKIFHYLHIWSIVCFGASDSDISIIFCFLSRFHFTAEHIESARTANKNELWPVSSVYGFFVVVESNSNNVLLWLFWGSFRSAAATVTSNTFRRNNVHSQNSSPTDNSSHQPNTSSW